MPFVHVPKEILIGGKVVMGKTFRIWKDRETGELRTGLAWQMPEGFEPLNLVFDSETKIIYYKFTEAIRFRSGFEDVETKVGYMSPFYSSNGKLCKFIDNQIVEI